MNFDSIQITKNRGWRGLAQATLVNSVTDNTVDMIFSFSQDVWDDMLSGYIVFQDDENYYVVEFDNLDTLPKRTQQRSVLITNFKGKVTDIRTYSKTAVISDFSDRLKVEHFKRNKNNHTTSDWNCIGLRVIPEI